MRISDLSSDVCSSDLVNSWGQPELPKKGSQVYGKPSKSDHTALYLDRDGKVQTVHYRMPEATKPKGAFGDGSDVVGDAADAILTPKVRPDATQKGHEIRRASRRERV